MTLQSFGTSLPAGTRSRFIGRRQTREWDRRLYGAARAAHGIIVATMPRRAGRIERTRSSAALAARSGPAGSRRSRGAASRHSRAASARRRTWKPRRCRRRSPPASRARRPRPAGSRSSSPTASGPPSTRWSTMRAWWCCTRTPSAPPAGSRSSRAFDIRSAPIVEWRWKVGSLIEGADNRVAAKEDSPVRLMFAFDGDKSRLPLRRPGRLLPDGEAFRPRVAVRAAAVRLGEHDSGRHGDRESVHAPRADAGRRERSRRRRQMAIAVAQSVRRFPARVPGRAGTPHGRRRADGHRQHGRRRSRPGTATSGSCPRTGSGCPRLPSVSLHAAPRYAAP